MRLNNVLLLLILAVVVCGQGCETVKGMKRDAQGIDLHLREADNWIQEYLW